MEEEYGIKVIEQMSVIHITLNKITNRAAKNSKTQLGDGGSSRDGCLMLIISFPLLHMLMARHLEHPLTRLYQ